MKTTQPPTLECPNCGKDGAEAFDCSGGDTVRYTFEQGQPLICGCPGHVQVNRSTGDVNIWIDEDALNPISPAPWRLSDKREWMTWVLDKDGHSVCRVLREQADGPLLAAAPDLLAALKAMVGIYDGVRGALIGGSVLAKLAAADAAIAKAEAR